MRRSGEGEDASAGSKVGVVDPGRNLFRADLSQSQESQSTKEMRLKQKQDRETG